MATTADTTTTVEERIERLEAQDQLRQLAHEYCHGLDKRDLARFLAVWTPDAVWALGDDVSPSGHDAIGATATAGIWPAFTETHHWTANHVMTWSDGKAHGTCDVSAVVRNTHGQWLIASATYVDTYANVGGRWLISRREATTHFTRPLVDS